MQWATLILFGMNPRTLGTALLCGHRNANKHGWWARSSEEVCLRAVSPVSSRPMKHVPARRRVLAGIAGGSAALAGGRAVAATQSAPDGPVVDIRDFGVLGRGDALVDDQIAKALAQLRAASPTAPTSAMFRPSGTLHFPPGRYRFARPIEIRQTMRILGASTGGNGGEATQFLFPANVDGIIVHRHNTVGVRGRGPDAGSGEGSLIEGITLIAEGAGARRDSGACGFRLRARTELHRCTAMFFAQDGFYLGASLDANTHPLGSTNQSKLEDCTSNHNGRHGFYFAGADGNAITMINPNMVLNGAYGYFDESFLGITVVGGHSASNGQLLSGLYHDETALVHLDGQRWFVHLGQERAASTTRPGTNADVWVRKEPGGGAPDIPEWRRGGRYISGGSAVLAGGGSSHIGPYCEGGQGHLYLGPSSSARGGLVGADGREFYGPGIYQKAEQRGWSTFGAVRSMRAAPGRSLEAELGTEVKGPTDVAYVSTVRDSTVPSGPIQETIFAGAYAFGQPKGAFFRATTGDTAPSNWSTFGRRAVQPHVFNAPVFSLSDARDANQTRIVSYGAAAPTDGDHARGEIVFNIAPSRGGVFAWSCVEGGSPGVWIAIPVPNA